MSDAIQGAGGVQGPRNIQQRTGTDQPVPEQAGELIIDLSPEKTIDMAFKGGNGVTLPQVADRCICLVAQQDPQFKPLTLRDNEDMPVKAQEVAARVFGDRLGKLNGMDGQDIDDAIPEGRTVFARDLKKLLQPLVVALDEKGPAGLMSMLGDVGASSDQRRTMGMVTVGGGINIPVAGEPPPKT